MLDSISNNGFGSYGADRRASTDGMSVSQPARQTSTQADDDTPIRQPQQNSENSDLDNREEQQLRDLKRRDQQVRAHEQAHIAAGGRYISSGAQFIYQTGPDGKRYAVGGEVSIDTSTVPGDPEATIRKAEAVARAALAPADPSTQDQAVAASARQTIAQARVELARMRMEEANGNTGDDATVTAFRASGVSAFAATASLQSEPEINLDEVV
jgi:hypothetical protein